MMTLSKEKLTQKTKVKTKVNLHGLLGLWPFFRPYLKEILFAFLALLVTAFMVLFFGRAIKYLIDDGFLQKDGSSLNLVLLSFIGATLLMAVAGYYRSSLINSVSEKAITDLRKKAYSHIIKISAEFFEVFKAGDVIARLTTDSSLLYNIISNSVSFLLRNLILFIGGICFLFFTSVKLSIISLALIPLAIAPIIVMGRKVKGLSNEAQEATASVGSHIEETINGIKTIQSYLCEEKEVKNFSNLVDGSLAVSLKKIKVRAMLVALVIASAFTGIAVVLWIGGHEVLSGELTSGSLSSFIFYSVITSTSLVALSQISGQLQSASSAAERIFNLLQVESPVKEAEVLQEFLQQKNVEISFDKVNFSYPSRQESLVLKNFDLHVKAGEKIALVGPSGTGKSTVLQLLLRFYDVSSGAILLNGINIKLISFSDLRQNFSYISQDCFIFSGTVFNNIAYVDKNITEAQVQQIINENPALHFINYLPQKLHSFVGEKGIKLSGGERQRIAIARAIVKNSPILLLDEATSALDNYNAYIIEQAIAVLAKDKTVITVAHKLSAISNCDRIVFIKDGEVAEVGKHHDLMEIKGLYAKMYEAEAAEVV